MKPRFYSWLLALVIGAGAAAGCSINLGNRGASDDSGTTVGKELMDLKEARDRGVISDTEYETQRQRVLERSEHHH